MINFESALRTVSPFEHRVLQCFSIFWEPFSIQTGFELLKSLNLKTPDGKAVSSNYATLLFNSLVKKNLLQNLKTGWKKTYRLKNDALKEFLTREARSEPWFDETINVIEANFSLKGISYWYDQELFAPRLLRDYRLSIYRKNPKETVSLFEKIVERRLEAEAVEIVRWIFTNPFQKEFLAEFDRSFQAEIIATLIEQNLRLEKSSDEFWEFVTARKLNDSPLIKYHQAAELLLCGRLHEAEKLTARSESVGEMLVSATIALLRRDFAKSVSLFEEAVKLWRSVNRKRKGFPDDWRMFFYALALYKTSEAKFHAFAEQFGEYGLKNHFISRTHFAVNAIFYYVKNNDDLAVTAYSQIGTATLEEKFLCILTAAVVPHIKAPNFTNAFEKSVQNLGYRWIEAEIANLRASKDESNASAVQNALRIAEETGFELAANIIPRLADWERALNTLLTVAEQFEVKNETSAKIDETRVAWLLNFKRREIQPVEQKFGKKGWTDGRNIALKRLFEHDVKNVTEQDEKVVKNSLKRYASYYYGGQQFDFIWEKALPELVGHPFLFAFDNPGVNLQLIDGEPSLIIKESGGHLELSFDTKIEKEGFVIQKETETRYKLLRVSNHHVKIAESLKTQKLRVPAAGRDKLLQAVRPLSTRIAIQSDLEEHFENLPSIEADKRLHALITPAGEGFHLEFFVKPFGKVPPYFKPGKGQEAVIADLDGVRTRTRRDLKAERKLVTEIEELCPFLAEFESPNYEWSLADAEDCLTALSEMEVPRQDGKLVVEWTKGQKLKLLGNINFDNFSLAVKGKNNWFEIEGKAVVNEDLVLSMKDLNRLLGPQTRNFIELSDGQFIAITEKLRKHLQSLNAVLDDKNHLHILRSGILEDLSGELENFKADKAWKQHLAQLKTIRSFAPELPTTFEAELRPYQTDGYNWLARLAHWGVGACLADDMGLGKTIMALALLVERAERGAALVVAPVSVCRNWQREARKFAPTLNFEIFGDGDRRAQVERLGKYDVLVTSYNLLQIEEELFTGQNFATIVLDEAQAVKNRHTKRSRTVMNLQGDFRLITTGTPIENHLGELWNLFNFINPGLLGSNDFFNEKFAVPIEKNKDETARRTLQNLIRPFVLRRRKNQVLDDLPAKTEIVLTVEMSEAERAFYEALRRDALERIEAQDGDAKDKRFRILAELTRLRLACCHPKLVNETVPLSSSKLELFAETLEELLENKHKALVFSQFVKHLALVKDYLDQKGISYQYLDGSTPPAVRQERIERFQKGVGEVFLISLKAGGTGLNLTAADYVIHLDPWWNPAVEDQATDRAHRIGQERPVTVYRLVTEETVEEKILKLHETKRDLADSLLEGADASGKLSADDLLALIAEV